MKDKFDLNTIITALNINRGLPEEVIELGIKAAMRSAYEKTFEDTNCDVEVNMSDRTLVVYSIKSIVDHVSNPTTQMHINEAKTHLDDVNIGDTVYVEVLPTSFSRIGIHAASQNFTSIVRSYEKKFIYDKYSPMKGKIVEGIVSRERRRSIFIQLPYCEAIIPINERVPTEHFRVNETIKALVLDVYENSNKDSQVVLSRSSKDFVIALLASEVPELRNEEITIVASIRDPGFRTKLIVSGTVDPVGACIGPRGSTIQKVINEIQNEKIDIIKYEDDIRSLIGRCLTPAKVDRVLILDPDNKKVVAIVDESQISKAIGKEGKNVGLVSRLLGWDIEIKTEYEASKLGYADHEFSARAKDLFRDDNCSSSDLIVVTELADISVFNLIPEYESLIRSLGINTVGELLPEGVSLSEVLKPLDPAIIKAIEEILAEKVEFE